MRREYRRALGALFALGAFIWAATAVASPAARPAKPPHVAASSAQPSQDVPASIAALARAIDDSETQLDAISRRVRANGLGDGDLRRELAAIPPIQATLASALDSLDPRLANADARLAQLGPPPAAGQPPEARETTQSRQEILRFRSAVDVEVKQARLLATEADQLTNHINDRRRQLFSERLQERGRSVLDPMLWVDFARSAPADASKLAGIIDREAALVVYRAGSIGAAVAWGLLAGLGVVLAVAARILLNRRGGSWLAKASAEDQNVGPLVAVWWIVVAGLTPLLAGLAIQGALTNAEALTPTFSRILSLFWKAIVYGALIEGVTRALLGPRRPVWRVASVPVEASDRLAFYPWAIGASAALGGLIAGMDGIVGFNAATAEAAGYLMLVLQIGVIVIGLSHIGLARVSQVDSISAMDGAAGPRPVWTLVATLAWLTLGAAGTAILAGYLALATFLIRELVWSAAIIAAVFLLMRGVDAAIAWLLSPTHPLGRAIRISIGLSAQGLNQLAELVSGLLRLGLVLGGWVAILAPFGADAQDVFGRITSTDLVLRFGQVTISPGALVGALLVFGVGLAATQVLRGWLESRYLPKTRLDVGVRTSVASVVTYVGIFVVVLVTCVDLGLSLDRIALLASALSVGIGFGLQAVIGNFVSGLILLAERPVKVGDWVAIGDQEGDIRRISVRATEIEMADRSRLIVPNSELVSKTVRNVTHGTAMGRVKIVLSLNAESDPLTVRDVLMNRLTAYPGALADPAPAVYLTDVKDGAMEFTAYVYLASPRRTFKAKSDLLFQILPDLKANGIALSSSNPVVHVAMRDRPLLADA